MPEVNLTTLSGPELRRLLDATRARGQAATTYLILQEMAERREGRRQRGLLTVLRRPPERRTIDLDLADSEDDEDDVPPAPLWRPPPRAQAAAFAPVEAEPEREPAPEPEPDPQPRRPRRTNGRSAAAPALADVTPAEAAAASPPEPRPLTDFRLPPPPEPELAVPPRPRRLVREAGAVAAGFAAGVVATAAVAWGMGGPGAQRPVASQAAPPSSALVRTAAAAPAPAPLAAPHAEALAIELAPEPATEPANDLPAEVEPTGALLPPDLPEGALASPDAEDLAAEEATQAAAVEAAEAPARETEVAAAPTGACASAPTPADRTICADPELRRLQQELRQAYARALDAHEDRALLRQRQLAWRDARSPVAEPDELARLYSERIRKLNAAAEAARQARSVRARGAD